MHKLKKAVAVAVMVGGIGLVGGGVAHADNGHNYSNGNGYNNGRGNGDPFPFNVLIDNIQSVECTQPFDAGLAFAPITTSAGGDVNQNVGNSCTVIGSIEN